MKSNEQNKRPDALKLKVAKIKTVNDNPRIGLVSLGCPKALVDSERILTRLTNEGYSVSGSYQEADAVIVNTCGFLNSAKLESLETIGEAIKENGRVIVTGCLGKDEKIIREQHPEVISVSGPQQYQKVIDAVHQSVPQVDNKFTNLIPKTSVKLTPNHYSYLKISEGCNNKCKFCIIPDIRGRLTSRSMTNILREAEKLVSHGVKELLVISQDTAAYGLDKRYQEENINGSIQKNHIVNLARELGTFGVWVRLHYMYPYPIIQKLISLMAEGLILPYLDMPLQHTSAAVLKRMSRPMNQVKMLKLIESWRKICPEITIRSTFIVGYPGETESEFTHLLDWLREAKLDRVGCFKYENVHGSRSKNLPNQCSEEQKDDRWHRLMKTTQHLSAQKLQQKVNTTQEVIVDSVDYKGAICRTKGDAPEIDGNLFIDKNFSGLEQGDIIKVKIEEASDYDLWGSML